MMRGTPFDQARNVCWQRGEVASEKEMNMIGLDGQREDLPPLLICTFIKNLFETVMNRTIQDVSPPLRTPDDRGDKHMNGGLFVLIFYVA